MSDWVDQVIEGWRADPAAEVPELCEQPRCNQSVMRALFVHGARPGAAARLPAGRAEVAADAQLSAGGGA